MEDHGDLLQARREKDRKRYSSMSPQARASYNAHRRELYHKQGEAARKRRRERERERYHSLEGESKKDRNERRAKLERDRYNRLSKNDLASRNAKRRDRAKSRKGQHPLKEAAPQASPPPMAVDMERRHPPVYEGGGGGRAVLAGAHMGETIPPLLGVDQHVGGAEIPIEGGVVVVHVKAEMQVGGDYDGGGVGEHHEALAGAPLPEATVDDVADQHHHHHHHMADTSAALAAEVAEQVIAGANLDGAMEAAAAAAKPPPPHHHREVTLAEDSAMEADTVQI